MVIVAFVARDDTMFNVDERIASCLPYLRVFYEVASCRSFTRAAERLHISQPAVTRQIKRLEAILGVSLFDRGSSPVQLTPAGRSLLGFVERSLSLLEEAHHLLESYREPTLKVGATRGYSKTTMPRILAGFQEENPKVRIVLSVDSSQGLERGVLEGVIDLAFLANPDHRRPLLFLPFREEELVCIASPSFVADLGERVSLADVVDYPFIVREKGSGTHKMVMEAFEAMGRKPKVLVEASSPEFIKEWVKAGKGLSIVTASSVEEEREEGKLRVLPIVEGLHLDVYVALLRGRRDEPLISAFLRYLGVR